MMSRGVLMYSVEEYRYDGITNGEFTYGKHYFVRKTKNSNYTMITTNDKEKMLFQPKLSIGNDVSKVLLKSFAKVNNLHFKNYKEYKRYLQV